MTEYEYDELAFVVDSKLSSVNHNRKMSNRKIHGVACRARMSRTDLLAEYEELKDEVRRLNSEMLSLVEQSEDIRLKREIFSCKASGSSVKDARERYRKL